MADPALLATIFEGLNPRQLEAVQHGDAPLLIIAGAGSGKTKTLVHRVACAMARGVEPGRILLLTFSRRAAAEMLRRVDGLIRQVARSGREQARLDGRQAWGGTFHAIAARLLRLHGRSIGLDPGFTILDRSDSEDLLDVVRTDLGLSRTDKRFPRKGTCLSIYSQCVNTGRELADILAADYPWCDEYGDALKGLFREYVDRKEDAAILDYDDLLLFWRELLADPTVGGQIRARFDMVLVDEYQDTNRLQAETLKLLRPEGRGLTVVGDDAQSIYAFRGATIRNILDFPQEFPDTTVVKLEQNYRSTQPILEATNRVIAEAAEGYQKALWTTRAGGQLPLLVPCEDENEQSEYVATRILEFREGGMDLRRQAVLFRASHHSILLEAELTRRKIPFVKYGGLKFTEAAHVKDLMAFLRLAENPRDVISGSRILTLLPGIGPKRARQLLDQLVSSGGAFHIWANVSVPAATAEHWPEFVRLMQGLAKGEKQAAAVQMQMARSFYTPLLERQFDNPGARLRDLEQLEQLATRFSDRASLLAEITLDPPASSEDFAGPPQIDEDYVVLSTIHSAKGLEWDAVYVIHAADGNIPSDMATKSVEEIEEERRLFYVALTRARDWLYVCHPHRYYHVARGPYSDRYGHAPLTRFLPEQVRACFELRPAIQAPTASEEPPAPHLPRQIRSKLRAMWS